MRFKIPALILTLATLSSCGWVQDKPKGTQNFQSKNLDLTCLQTAPLQAQKLFNGEYTSSPADMAQEREIWACLDLGLNTFSSYTRGANGGFYTADELRTFANRYLPKGKLFTEKFVNSIFRLKSAVVGGDETKLTRKEIVQVRGKIKRFGDVIEPLAPYIGALLARDAPDSPVMQQAGPVLNQFVTGLALVLADSATSVAWSDLQGFIVQLELYTSKGRPSALTLVREQFDVFKSIKLLMVGGSEEAIEKEKWTPIFESISHVYNAIFLTSSTSAMLERLSIDIQSTEAEQQTAVNKLKEVFIRLKGDESLTSHVGIEKMSDRFAKLLLVNSFLFPRARGSLALKAFLGSEELRKIAASIIQDIPPPGTRFEDNQIQSLAAHVISFFEQAALSDELRNGNSIPVSLSALQDDLATLAPLLKDDSQRDLIFSGLNAAKAIIPAFIGKDAEHLNAKDLGFLVHKSLDLYFTWVPSTPKGLNEQIGASLDILLREPGINIVGQSEMVTAVESIKKVMLLLKMDSKIDWDLLLAFIPKGMRLKSILFQNSDSSISSYEISQIAYLYDPFRRNDDISVAIAATANLLANRPFAEVQFEDLLPAIEVFLPKGQTLASLGINAKVLGDAKFILIGGGKSSIKPPEYATLARAFSALLSKVGSKLKNLPKNFQPGFNSLTVDLAGGFLEGFMAARTSDLPMNDLKPLILDLAHQAGFKLRERTVDKFLIGFNTRILNHSKDAKPNSLNQLVLKTPQLEVFLPLIESIKVELADLESAYAGIDVKTTTLSRTVLLSRLKNSQNRLIIEKINPLLDGDTHLHHFPKKGDTNNQFYEYDLAFKAVIQSVLTWIIPFYQLEEDPQPSLIRLSLFDLTDLLSDINDLVFDLRLSFSNTEPSITAVARMQNMNLFTQVGNGDKYMDTLEGTEFLTITSGGKVLLGKIQDKLFPRCFPGITDYTTVKSISYACLSEVFFSKEYVKEIYTPVIPQLVDQYLKWNPQQLETYRQAAFTATRPGWTETGSLGMADFESLISLPYFLENVFERFDLDQDDTLRFSELMTAFPTFCGEINAAAGGKLKGSCVPGEAPGQIEAVYGYLLFYGHPPTGMERGNTVWTRVRSTAAILRWFRFWRNLDRDPQVRDREAPIMERQDMLSIISNLAASTAEIEATPELALEIPE